MSLIWIAIILGIIEGLTEFLPVSSTGHLIIASSFLNFKGDFANTFNIVIQVGAMFAVVIYFWGKLFPDFKNRAKAAKTYNLWGKVIIGIIPAIILGTMFADKIDEYLMENIIAVAGALIVGALLLLYAEKNLKRVKTSDVDNISYGQAFIVGLFQCLAMWPGMSRSSSTIIGGLFLGLSREVAAEFSFFLAVPTIGGAALLKLVKLIKHGFAFESSQWMGLILGTFVSFAVAYVVIAAFMNYIKSKKLAPFAYYRIVFGVLMLVLAFI